MLVSELVEHPKTWLTSNALWVHGGLNVACQGKPDIIDAGKNTERTRLFPVRFVRTTEYKCLDQDGQDMACWELRHETSLGFDALVYYLPYLQNQTRSMRLADKGSLFFTDTIDGCTFAAGPEGNPVVSHLNYTEENDEGVRAVGGKIDQAKIDSELTSLYGNQKISALKKADYRKSDAIPNVTVLGVRGPGGWRFVYQRRHRLENSLRDFQLVSVHTVKSLP